MIEEQYVDFETAKLLKEKGFKEITQGYINADQEVYMLPFEQGVYELTSKQYPYPTQQMAMRWLREEHNLFIKIRYFHSQQSKEWDAVIFSTLDGNNMGQSPDGYYSYEQACEIAIKYCLENLI